VALAATETKNSENVLRVGFGGSDAMAHYRLEAITATNGPALWYKSLPVHMNRLHKIGFPA
jgi:hypothetical protein